jgi:transcriptional regulator with XRE-family HTH domain
MSKERPQDPSMARARVRFEQSGLSLHALGLSMGYPEETARKSAWQFIQKTDDPRISMLRRFAKAMGVPLAELLVEEKKNGRSK